MPATLTATTHVEVTRLAGQIGAEITGADTGTPLSDEVIARIRARGRG
jgi:alpha-ketoglutarate-dependent sulfate ester dioxygenase